MPLPLLLVEDDAAQALALRALLVRAHPGAEVAVAATLAAALDKLRGSAFAAVLLDLSLPDSDGLATFHAVRQAAPEAALLVITGHDDDAVAAAVAAAGAQDFLVKGSFTPTMLQRSLRAALERERLLRDLREQEARFRGVVESLGEGVVLTDFERITYVNPRMAEMTGFRRQDLVGKALADSPFFIADPDDHEQRLERRRAGMPEVWEMPLRRADYSVMWAQVHGAPVRDADGEVVGTVAAFADVTAQRAAERARQEAEARLRQVVAHSPAVLYALAPGPPHSVTWMSENAAGILGFAPDDFRLLPDLWSQRVHPDDVAAMPRTVEQLRSGKDTWTAEYRFRHADGRWVWLADRTSVVRAADGAPIELVGACQDVTAERQLEEMLRQAQKMEAVGRLAGGVAHDFNNLLTAIGGYSELLLMRLPGDDPSRYELEEIRRAGERAAALTRQLLAFSRRQVLQPRVLDLNVVVEELERMLRRLIGEDVRLATVLAAGPLRVKADPGQLEQVVINLAVNARDAMPNGGRLSIVTDRREVGLQDSRAADARPGRWACLHVADTGVGMDQEVLAHIFEPFYTTKEQGKGTGLGLSTVYGIVQQSGGWIEVDSAPGEGTVFTMYLPEVAEPVPQRPPAETPARAEGAETVVVVEDEPAVRALVCRSLRARGYTVLEAGSGSEAIAVVAAHQGTIDLLLTDVVMPDLRGPELRDRLRSSLPRLRTLFMSGYSEDPAAREAAAPGAAQRGVGFLQKPFTPETLQRAVRELLDGAAPVSDRTS